MLNYSTDFMDYEENNYNTPGVNHVVTISIVAARREINTFKHFELTQSTSTHHQFKLTLHNDVMGEPETSEMNVGEVFLGKRIFVNFSYKNLPDSPERGFYGTITKVALSRDHRNYGDIILTGYSPTILLDKAPHLQSFGGDMPISLNAIANYIFQETLGGNYDAEANALDKNVAYSAQYAETHYNYLARLAYTHGEQFYYDGMVLRFGKLPSPNDAIQLTLGTNVENLETSIEIQHVNPSYYGYNSAQNQVLATGLSSIKPVSNLAKKAYEISKKTLTADAWAVAPLKARTTKDVDAAQDNAAGSAAVKTFVATGRTSVPFLYPGCQVDMHTMHPETREVDYLTRLMITNVKHTVDTLGNYVGEFEAIGAGTGYLPKPDFNETKAEPQIATVIDNLDPENLGRVMVRLDWQQSSEHTEWIRIMTPDAGSSNEVSKNRGFVFIPEIGDQVMVGFVHNHPDRPYVMGSLFHGNNAAGGGPANHKKSITSRTGITVEMDDTENQGSIIMKDPSGSFLHCEGNRNLTITAPETMTLNSKNLNINVEENMNVNVGKNQTIDVKENIITTAGADITQTAAGEISETSDGRAEMVSNDFKRESASSNEVSGEHTIFSHKQDLTMLSSKIVDINSTEKSKLF